MDTEENKFPYTHTLEVVLTTQFTKDEKYLAMLIKQILGPWCEAAKVTRCNEVRDKV
jgi:hypothetical protein